MELCAACRALIGQRVEVAAHKELTCDDTHLRSDGKLEIFRCRVCNARWERHESPAHDMPGSKVRIWRQRS
jgi:hypothetical protein